MSIVRMMTVILLAFGYTPSLFAELSGAIQTDRFGYTGSTTRYVSLADAENSVNPLNTISIGNRDLSLFSVANLPSYYTDANITSGAWYYTTDASGNPGFGNTRGNTGEGYLQIYENPGASIGSLTRDTVDYLFSDFDGTYYTQFSYQVAGSNADATTSLARLSPFNPNTDDEGIYHSYDLNLVASGLQGTLSPTLGIIEATNHPSDVTGTFVGLFENTSPDPTKAGFYTFDLALDMDSWAYSNRNSLTFPGSGFPDSYFAASTPVPEPGTLAIYCVVVGVIGGRRYLAARTRRRPAGKQSA